MTCGEDAYLVFGRALGEALANLRPQIDACLNALLLPSLCVVPLNVDYMLRLLAKLGCEIRCVAVVLLRVETVSKSLV